MKLALEKLTGGRGMTAGIRRDYKVVASGVPDVRREIEADRARP